METKHRERGPLGVSGCADETALVERLVERDDTALRTVYAAHAQQVYRTALRVTANDELARDSAQEVFIFLWEHPERIDLTVAPLVVFLRVLARRRAVDALRSQSRRATRELVAHFNDGARRTVVDETFAVVESTATIDRAARLHAAIDRLPCEQRDALTLAYFGSCTVRELATRLRIPEGTAKSRIRLGLVKLRAELRAQAHEAEADGARTAHTAPSPAIRPSAPHRRTG